MILAIKSDFVTKEKRMKFGKSLAERQLPEWSRNYISYKLLKHLIADIEKAQRQDKSVDDSITAYFYRLDREVEKVNSFFVYKRSELERRLRILSDKSRAALALNPQQFNSPVLSGSGGSGGIATQPQPPLQQPASLSSPQTALFEDSTLLSSLMETKELVHKLLRFANLNLDGFRKIMKKFDKKLKREAKELYLQTKVQPLPFADSHSMDMMLESIEEMSALMQQRLLVDEQQQQQQMAQRLRYQTIAQKENAAIPARLGSEYRQQSTELLLADDAAGLESLIESRINQSRGSPLNFESPPNGRQQITASDSTTTTTTTKTTDTTTTTVAAAAVAANPVPYGIAISGLPAAISTLSMQSAGSNAASSSSTINHNHNHHNHHNHRPLMMNGRDGEDRIYSSLLASACQKGALRCLKYLLVAGADTSGRDDVNERSLLHKLVLAGGNGERLTRLAAKGPSQYHPLSSSAQQQAKQHQTVASAPPEEDNPAIIEYILTHSELAVRSLAVPDVFGRLPLHYAALYGQVKITKLLARYHDPASWPWLDHEGHSPLFYAVLRGFTPIVGELLGLRGVDVDDLSLAPCETVLSATTTTTATTAAAAATIFVSPVPNVYSTADGGNFTVNGTPLSSSLPKGLSSQYTPLELCCKFGHYETAKLLLERGANIDYVDEDGETPLHHACRSGFAQICNLLVEPSRFIDNNNSNGGSSIRPASLEIADKLNGWTPLFLSAIEGQMECVQILLKAGAKANRTDWADWTPHEHAVFRGHLSIAALLKPLTLIKHPGDTSTIESEQLPANSDNEVQQSRAQTVRKPERSYGHNYLQGQCLILVTLGFNDTRQSAGPIDIFESQIVTYPSLSMVISATNAIGEPAIVDLPVRNSPEPILFFTQKGQRAVDSVMLRCDIQPTYGTKRQVIGRATALLRSFGGLNGCGGRASIPIIGSQFEVIGMFNFEFIVVYPFTHPNLSIDSKRTYWKSIATKVIGHRGAGANKSFNGTGGGNLQIGENTVLSLITAASLGAEYVEFDVQLTKDLVPVIYHDWILSETGLNIPVSSVTLDEFHSLGPQKKKQQNNHHNQQQPLQRPAVVGNDENNVIINHLVGRDKVKPGGKAAIRSGSRSDDDSELYSISQRRLSLNALDSLNHRHEPQLLMTIDGFLGRQPKYRHHGGRGDVSIKAPFATLKETLTDVPKTVGFNIEVKYPSLMETEQNGLNNAELNVFVDQILQCVYDNASDRSIIFSSFHPETCLMLSYKQPNYPVFFLTEAGTEITYDVRCNSLQEAIRFAKFADLLGIVTVSDPLIAAPYLARTIKENGLLLFSYGALNNDADNAELQKKFGVDAVIVDKIVPIVNRLVRNGPKS